jgi:hypothetical protein
MAHAQKPDFIFRRNGRVHLNRWGRPLSRLLTPEVCASEVVMLDTPRSEVAWDYWLHTPFASSPSLPLPCVTVCHHVSTGLYLLPLADIPVQLTASSYGEVPGLTFCSFRFIQITFKCMTNSTLRDAAQILHQVVLYFPNATQFHGTRLNVV